MPVSSDVFIVSFSVAAEPAEALRQALKQSGVNPARVQDFLFGWDGLEPRVNPQELARQAGLVCPTLALPSSLRALFFATQSILCEDIELALVAGSENEQTAALLLVGPAAVGIYNLMPLARIDARSLNSVDDTLKKAERSITEIGIRLEGTCGALLLAQLLAEPQGDQSAWGMLVVGQAAMLVEKV
jgi:hypothetical protein